VCNLHNELAAHSQASEAGVCRGSDTPIIYVGDIDMCIQKSNT